MGVNIKIPYLESAGETQISVFNKIYFVAKTITNYLVSQKGKFVVNDAASFVLKLGKNFLNVAESFLTVIQSNKDSNSAYALFRVQADYLATLLLIFEGKCKDEMSFRYLLYLIDGLSQRVESLENLPKDNGSISKEDYSALIKQMTEAKDNATKTIEYCYNEINKHPYKSLNTNLFDDIIQQKQWKYKEFNDAISKCKKYSWKELYQLIDSRSDIAAFISLCSHYVHGNVNSLLSGCEDEDFDPIIHCNIILINRYVNFLKSLYGEKTIDDILKFCLFGITIKVC